MLVIFSQLEEVCATIEKITNKLLSFGRKGSDIEALMTVILLSGLRVKHANSKCFLESIPIAPILQACVFLNCISIDCEKYISFHNSTFVLKVIILCFEYKKCTEFSFFRILIINQDSMHKSFHGLSVFFFIIFIQYIMKLQ